MHQAAFASMHDVYVFQLLAKITMLDLFIGQGSDVRAESGIAHPKSAAGAGPATASRRFWLGPLHPNARAYSLALVIVALMRGA